MACAARRKDTLGEIIDAPVQHHAGLAASAAWRCSKNRNETFIDSFGVLPAWTAIKTIALAKEVEAVLQGNDLGEFLHQMYGNEPAS